MQGPGECKVCHRYSRNLTSGYCEPCHDEVMDGWAGYERATENDLDDLEPNDWDSYDEAQAANQEEEC